MASDVARWEAYAARVEERATWIAKVTVLANDGPNFPHRDSEAARWKAAAAARKKANKKNEVDGRRRRSKVQPPKHLSLMEGGHAIARTAADGSWICTVCNCRARSKKKLGSQRCEGDKSRWSGKPAVQDRKGWIQNPAEDNAENRSGDMRKHRVVASGTVQWCLVCGSFAETKVACLKRGCKGPPPRQMGSGGLRQQLEKLRSGHHPVSGIRLPEPKNLDGTPVVQWFGYARRQLSGGTEVDPKFVEYTPEVFPIAKEVITGRTAKEKGKARLVRVQFREKCEALRVRKARVQEEADEAIRSFINGPIDIGNKAGDEQHFSDEAAALSNGSAGVSSTSTISSTGQEDRECEAFWANIGNSDHLEHRGAVDAKSYRGPGWHVGTKATRRDILASARKKAYAPHSHS
jgi:hypothetical protein